MEKANWREMSGGNLLDALERIWKQLGSNAGPVVERINADLDFARRLAAFAINPAGIQEPILKLENVVRVRKNALFVAKDSFVEGKTINGVSILELNRSFKAEFFEKIEKNIGSAKLRIYELLKSSQNLPNEERKGIIPELDHDHVIMLSHLFGLLAHKQKKKDFTWVTGYVYNVHDVLRTVNALWYTAPRTKDCGWYVCSSPIEQQKGTGWSIGLRIVSL